MIKRKFGMACLNITQGRFGGYSHANLNAYDLAGMDSGIDRWITWNDVEVIGIHEYSKTGFANTICFYDSLNDITLAMTHVNTIPSGCVVGKVYKSGETIYYEGTKGNATGNHIHLEIGQGRQTGKTKINGVWQLQNLINIEDYFYLDLSYTEERNNGGYTFSYTSEGSTSTMGFNNGYQLINWNGKTVHVYKQADDMDIGLMSVPNGVSIIDKINNDLQHWAKMNCNYFNLATGEHYGVEQSFELDNAPKNRAYLVVWIDLDNKVHFGYSDEYWLSKKDVKCAFTPFGVFLHDGQDQDIISTAFTDKRNSVNSQSLLLQCSDGKYAFAVFEGGVNVWNCRNFAKEYGCTFMCALDSGGSSQLVSEGVKKVYTGRALPNVLTFYKDPKGILTPSEPDTPSVTECEECKEKQAKIDELQKLNDALKAANNGLGEKLKNVYAEKNKQ